MDTTGRLESQSHKILKPKGALTLTGQTWLNAVSITATAIFGMSAVRAEAQASGVEAPVLVNTCLITDSVQRLAEFYEPVLQIKANRIGSDYAEFQTIRGVLAIFSSAAQERYIPRSTMAGHNQSVIIEFLVADVDREYRRLQGVVKVWVKPPTTQPWGTRSIYFRDPDGNLVDLFMTAAKQ